MRTLNVIFYLLISVEILAPLLQRGRILRNRT